VRVAHHAIDVAASPDECWRALADLGSWPRWFPFLRSARALDGAMANDPWRIGGRMKLVLGVGPIRVPVTTVVQEIDPLHKVRWIGTGFGVSGDHAYTIEVRAPHATRVTSHEEFTGLGARFMTAGIFPRIDSEAHRSMERFKAWVERKTVP
jgi:hypothetical protein